MSRFEALIFPIILVVLSAVWGTAFYYQHDGEFGDDAPDDNENIYPDDFKKKIGNMDESGFLEEYSEESLDIYIPEPNIISINFSLTWVDEPVYQKDGPRNYSNEPDEFSLNIKPPAGDEITTPLSTTGEINVTITFEYDKYPDYDNSYNYVVTVICEEAGDQIPQNADPLGLHAISDTGNAWQLFVEYEYYA